MREINFRAWCEEDKSMYYPDGNYEFHINSDAITYSPRYNQNELYSYSTAKSEFEKEIVVMQFTGLKENAYEKGNKDIYEGDIIEFIDGKRLVVEWNDDTCKFQYSDGTDLNDGERYGSHKMIVGNIYENTELLNK